MDRKLYESAASGDVDFLRGIIDYRLITDTVTVQKNTLLHIAVNFNRFEFSSLVLELWPSLVLKANTKGESPLHLAAQMGRVEVAQLLVKTARRVQEDVESRVVDVQIKELLRMVNKENDTALHVAAKTGQFGVAKLLMEEDKEVLDSVNNMNASPLFLAVEGGFFDIVSCILRTSLAANVYGPNGMTALHSAVIRGHKDIMKLLVEARPDMIEEVDTLGWTAMHYAAFKGDVEATKLFMERHDNIAYALDKDGACSLHIAASEGHVKVVNELIEHCPDLLESVNKRGRNALHAAVIGGQFKVVKYILRMKELSDIVNELDDEGNSALHLAVACNNHHIISLLARDKRVVKTVVNKEMLTAYDVFKSRPSEPFAEAKVRFFLENTHGVPYWQRQVKTKVKKLMNKEDSSSEEEDNSREQTRHGRIKNAFDVNLLMATLIATVTFTAAFTMPGGYENDGPHKGTATLASKTAFKVFVVFDALAFFLSVAMLVVHVITSLRHVNGSTKYKKIVLLMLWYALDGLILAFASGLYVMLADRSVALAVIGFVMTGCAFIICDIFLFVNAVGDPFLGLCRLTNFPRNQLFRYGII